jgi:carbamoyltransferase
VRDGRDAFFLALQPGLMRILGLSAFHRDAAAVLLIDGLVVAAAQEERFTETARDSAFPRRAIRSCLAAGAISASDLDRVVFYEKPLRKFERFLARALRTFPRSSRAFTKGAFHWLGERLWIKNSIAEELEVAPEKVLFVSQAEAQLANAFFASPFDEAALLLLDDVCEWSTTALGRGRGRQLELVLEARHPHSLGLFASAWTQYLGFTPGEDEHEFEALAALGAPKFAAEVERLFRGSEAWFELDTSAFAFDEERPTLFTSEFERRFGPARRSGDPLRLANPDAHHADLAASAQQVLELRTLALARELHERVPSTHLCLAGLLSESRGLVARLAAEGPFEQVFVPPAPGKDGGALGAAWIAHHALTGAQGIRATSARAPLEDIDTRAEPGAKDLGSSEAALAELATRLARGERVGWVRGALEFSRSSLVARLVLVQAGAVDARARLNSALQHVESFLPCRVAVPEARATQFFDLPAAANLAARGARVFARATPRLREQAPSAVLADGRAWPQIVAQDADPELSELLRRQEEATGAPLLLITDFALRGAPVVRHEAAAVEAFGRSTLDALVAGPRLYTRG